MNGMYVVRKFHKADTMTPAGPAPLNKDPFAREGSRSRALRGFEALIRPPVHSSNVGYRMMMKQGWTEGSGLGSRAPGRIEPIECDAATSSFLGIGCTRYKSIVTDERAELLLRVGYPSGCCWHIWKCTVTLSVDIASMLCAAFCNMMPRLDFFRLNIHGSMS